MHEFYFSGQYTGTDVAATTQLLKSKASSQLSKKMQIIATRYAHSGVRLVSAYHKLAYLASMYFPEMEGQTLKFTDALLSEYVEKSNLAARAFKVLSDAYGVQFTLQVSDLSDVEDSMYLEDVLGRKSQDALLAFLLDTSSWIELGEGYTEGTGISILSGTHAKAADEVVVKPYFEYLQVAAPRSWSEVAVLGNMADSTMYTLYGHPLSAVFTAEELELFYAKAVVTKLTVAAKFGADDLPPIRVLPFVVCKDRHLRCTSNVKLYRRNFPSDIEFRVKVPAELYDKLFYNTCTTEQKAVPVK